MRSRRHFVAVVAALIAGTMVSATAGAVTASVSLSASATSVAVTQPVTLTVTANQSVTGTGSVLRIVDTTAGQILGSCSSGTSCSATTTQKVATSHAFVGRFVTSGGTTSSARVTVKWSDPTVAAAGDIACDPADANFAGTNTGSCQMGATAKTIAQLQPNYLLPLGDTQYALTAAQGQPPTLSQYTNGYGRSWGALPSSVAGLIVRPLPGNHEWGDVNETNAQPLNASTYFQYFTANLPSGVSASSDWYSFDVPVSGGTWHFINLDSECGAIGGCGPGSAQESWLRNDLAAHQGQCIAASWHEPRWSTAGEGDSARYATLWQDLYNGHAAMMLAGHEHVYEHLGPADGNGNAVAGGVSEFVVGTGGVDLGGWASPPRATDVYRQNTAFGVLSFTLHATGMDYAYRTTAGTVPDHGTLGCPGVSTSTGSAPVVSGVSPVSGPAAGGTVVTISGSGFGGATGVRFGSVAATKFTVVSSSSISATAPALMSTVDVTVSSAGGTSGVSAADEWTPVFANGGYGVSLVSSGTSAVLGAGVSLTATSNQDVCATPYGISIMDVTANVEVAHTGCGTSLTTSVSQSAAGTHRYVGMIANVGGANAQADSAPIIITWN